MDADSHAHLRERLADLKRIDGIDWKSITEWTALVRPLLREHYSKHIAEFDEAAKRKHAPIPPSFGGQKVEIDNELEKKLAVQSYRVLVAFVEGLVNIPVSGAPRTFGERFDACVRQLRDVHVRLRALEDEAGAANDKTVADAARSVHLALEGTLKLLG